MSVLVVIDPGMSTGVAVFVDGRLNHSFTTLAPHDRLRRTLSALRDEDEVVVEKGPAIRRQAATCEPVEALATELAPNIQWVRPTAWKPDPHAITWPSDNPSTRHERDAIKLGRHWLARQERNDGDKAA